MNQKDLDTRFSASAAPSMATVPSPADSKRGRKRPAESEGVRKRTLDRAIVLAAGMGSRLVSGQAYPKPLKPVSNVALLVRILRTLQTEGIREAVIITGHLGAELKLALMSEPSLVLKLTFVENTHYELKNGVSVLAAREYVQDGALLTMADHLYSPEIVRRLRAMDLPDGACALGVDFDVERCFDIDDATKVTVEQGRIATIAKELPTYDAIDTGVFRIGPALIDELEKVYERTGDCSLSDGVRALAGRGMFYACDVGDARWIDVDTPEALARAEAMIRVFGDALGDEPALPARMDPEAIESFAPTWVRAAVPYKEDHFELAAQRDVVRMMSNESPFTPSPRVIEAIVAAATRGNLYPTSGLPLRKKIGAREGFDEHHVMLGAGSAEIIDLVLRTFVAAGEEVLLSVPTFSMYEARTRVIGGIPVLVPMTPDAEFDVPNMIAAVTERTKVMFVCTPNNPTGNRIQEAQLRRLLRLGLPTVIDEAYYELGDEPQSLAYLISEFPNAILIRTFSKAFGLAGIRLGYAIAHPVATRLLGRVKLPWNVSSITLAAATAALDDLAELEDRLQNLREGRAYLTRELSRIPGAVVQPSEANFVLIDTARCGVSSDAVMKAMLDRGILVRVLTTHHAGRSMVRITVGNTEQNARCVQSMRDVLMPRASWSSQQLATDAE
jgi:histidinol-phosphate aminotransferase